MHAALPVSEARICFCSPLRASAFTMASAPMDVDASAAAAAVTPGAAVAAVNPDADSAAGVAVHGDRRITCLKQVVASMRQLLDVETVAKMLPDHLQEYCAKDIGEELFRARPADSGGGSILKGEASMRIYL